MFHHSRVFYEVALICCYADSLAHNRCRSSARDREVIHSFRRRNRSCLPSELLIQEVSLLIYIIRTGNRLDTVSFVCSVEVADKDTRLYIFPRISTDANDSRKYLLGSALSHVAKSIFQIDSLQLYIFRRYPLEKLPRKS